MTFVPATRAEWHARLFPHVRHEVAQVRGDAIAVKRTIIAVKGFLIPGSTGDGWEMADEEIRELLDFIAPEMKRLGVHLLIGVLKTDASTAKRVVQETAARIGDGNGVIVCDLARRREFLGESDGVFLLRPGHGGEVRARAPSFPTVGRAAQQQVNRAPVAPVGFTGLAIRQHGAALRRDDARDAIERVAVLLRLK
ncbi:MAG: hypothetical protein FJ381_15200 [Verrucomicrobia bacterium]|nr:hypothetical protein [Verrucomicrobiota bacterium]